MIRFSTKRLHLGSSCISLIKIALLCALSASPVKAQTADPAITSDVAAQLNARITDLERKASRVDELEAEIKALKANVAAAQTPVTPDVPDQFPKVQMNILSDVTFHYGSDRDDPNTFANGDVDAVVTAKLSDQASVLGDFVVASNQGSFAFEIERFLLQYHVNDYFNIEAGRFHTSIGYYTNVYHNGTYFQTATERPEIYLFEDGEGILPIHIEGVSINGEIPSGNLRLRYVAEVANGRQYTADTGLFSLQDDNSYKAVNIALSARPEALPGLQVGGSLYHDLLTPVGLARTNQWIASAYIVYKNSEYEWLNEFVFMRNTPRGNRSYDTSAAYTQFAKRFEKFEPYVRLQWRSSPEADPVLALIQQNASVWGPTLGIRYDFTPMMALKLEYQHTERHQEPSFDEVTVQWTTRF